MITHAVDRDPGLFQLSLGLTQFVETVADLDPDMVEPSAAPTRWPRGITDLDQQ